MTDTDGVIVRAAGSKGLGVFARRPFQAGAVVLVYAPGRVVQLAEVASLPAWDYEHLRELSADTYEVLPAPRCYLNHSCDPSVVDLDRTVRALCPILEGEEITLDYRMNAHDDGDVWEMLCDCGAEEGPHVVRGDFWSLSAETQQRYLTWAPEFIRREYERRNAEPSAVPHTP